MYISNFIQLRYFYEFFDIEAGKLWTKDSCKNMFYDDPNNSKQNCVWKLLRHLKAEEACPVHNFANLYCKVIKEGENEINDKIKKRELRKSKNTDNSLCKDDKVEKKRG